VGILAYLRHARLGNHQNASGEAEQQDVGGDVSGGRRDFGVAPEADDEGVNAVYGPAWLQVAMSAVPTIAA
jgi:hypothetical protein